MAAIVQWLERLIVVQDVEGSNPSSRPIHLLFPTCVRFRCIIEPKDERCAVQFPKLDDTFAEQKNFRFGLSVARRYVRDRVYLQHCFREGLC